MKFGLHFYTGASSRTIGDLENVTHEKVIYSKEEVLKERDSGRLHEYFMLELPNHKDVQFKCIRLEWAVCSPTSGQPTWPVLHRVLVGPHAGIQLFLDGCGMFGPGSVPLREYRPEEK